MKHENYRIVRLVACTIAVCREMCMATNFALAKLQTGKATNKSFSQEKTE